MHCLMHVVGVQRGADANEGDILWAEKTNQANKKKNYKWPRQQFGTFVECAATEGSQSKSLFLHYSYFIQIY